MRFKIASSLAMGLLLGAVNLSAKPQLVGVAQIPGDTSDLSGIEGILEDGSPANRLGGFGSAVTWSGTGDLYWAATDRGPADGKTSFHTRLHKLAIGFDSQNKLQATLLNSIPLVDADGSPFIGLSSAFDLEPLGPEAPTRALGRRFDPEGIAVFNNRIILADEYGPFMFEFGFDGKKTRTLNVPDKFLVEVRSGNPVEEAPPHNVKGRQPNRGMEGLTINPSSGMLYGIMQSSLIQDNAQDAAANRVGTIVRIVEVNPASGEAQREFAYVMDSPKNGISEILAINGSDFLVLERDGKAGDESKTKRIYRISINEATDVSGVTSLPCCEMPSGMASVKKSLFLDLLDASYNLAGSSFPEKPEGLTFGPDYLNGDRLLLVTVDNDFVATQPSVIWGFRVTPF